jgi:hypothetical protein
MIEEHFAGIGSAKCCGDIAAVVMPTIYIPCARPFDEVIHQLPGKQPKQKKRRVQSRGKKNVGGANRPNHNDDNADAGDKGGANNAGAGGNAGGEDDGGDNDDDEEDEDDSDEEDSEEDSEEDEEDSEESNTDDEETGEDHFDALRYLPQKNSTIQYFNGVKVEFSQGAVCYLPIRLAAYEIEWDPSATFLLRQCMICATVVGRHLFIGNFAVCGCDDCLTEARNMVAAGKNFPMRINLTCLGNRNRSGEGALVIEISQSSSSEYVRNYLSNQMFPIHLHEV